jgi:hypothetical protein
MSQRLQPRRPRNPFVVPSLMRHAGSHRRSATAQRQRAARELRAELQRHP